MTAHEAAEYKTILLAQIIGLSFLSLYCVKRTVVGDSRAIVGGQQCLYAPVAYLSVSLHCTHMVVSLDLRQHASFFSECSFVLQVQHMQSELVLPSFVDPIGYVTLH